MGLLNCCRLLHDLSSHKNENWDFIYQEVWHRCYLCGELVLLDNDHLGGHIKSVHKMKEKAYKEKYIVSNTKAAKISALAKQNCKDNDLRIFTVCTILEHRTAAHRTMS